MSRSAPAILAPLTLGASTLYSQQRDQRRQAENERKRQQESAASAEAELKLKNERERKRRADLGFMAQASLRRSFSDMNTRGGTLLTSPLGVTGNGQLNSILGG